MSVNLLKPSEIKSLLALAEKMNYKFKTFTGDGDYSKTLLLEDCDSQHQVVGKVVARYNLGEFQIWPKLQHENLNPLLDMMTNDEGATIFISPLVGKNLREVIEDTGFVQHPKSFLRKKGYAKNILRGLEYLHRNSISLMNLRENTVLINSSSDKAIISDFSCAINANDCEQVPFFEFDGIAVPPEGKDNNVVFPKPFDMWTCGFLFLQMFTKHVLPWCSLGSDLLDGLDIELLRRTNKSSNLRDDAATDLKGFLMSFFNTDPTSRATATDALSSWYLKASNDRLDEPAREFWKAACVIRPFNDQLLGEGDTKTNLIDSGVPQSKTDAIFSPTPSVWDNNKVSPLALDEIREQLNRLKEKFNESGAPEGTCLDEEATFDLKQHDLSKSERKFKERISPPSCTLSSSLGLEKLFIGDEKPLHYHTEESSCQHLVEEKFPWLRNNSPEDQSSKGSRKSPKLERCASQTRTRNNVKILDAEEFSWFDHNSPADQSSKGSFESLDFGSQTGARPKIKVLETENFYWLDNNSPSNQSYAESLKSFDSKTENLPKIKIQGSFLRSKSRKENVEKVSPPKSDFTDGYRTTSRIRTEMNGGLSGTSSNVSSVPRTDEAVKKTKVEYTGLSQNKLNTTPTLNHPSYSKWPSTAQVKSKQSQKTLKKNAKPNATDAKHLKLATNVKLKTTETKLAAKAVKPKTTGTKLAGKTVKPKETEAKLTKAKAVKQTKSKAEELKEWLEDNIGNDIGISMDTPLFTKGKSKGEKIPFEILPGEIKKKKGLFHLPCKKNKLEKKSKSKGKFGWLFKG